MYISGPRAGDVGVPDALLVWEAVPWHQLGLDTGWCTPAYCTGASGALSYTNAVRGPNTCENRYITDRLLLGELCTCEPLATGFDGVGTYTASPGGQE